MHTARDGGGGKESGMELEVWVFGRCRRGVMGVMGVRGVGGQIALHTHGYKYG